MLRRGLQTKEGLIIELSRVLTGRLLRCLLGLAIILTSLGGALPADAATTIRLQCVYPKSSTPDHMEFFAKKVKQYTKGQVAVKLYWPGQLAKTAQLFSTRCGRARWMPCGWAGFTIPA